MDSRVNKDNKGTMVVSMVVHSRDIMVWAFNLIFKMRMNSGVAMCPVRTVICQCRVTRINRPFKLQEEPNLAMIRKEHWNKS